MLGRRAAVSGAVAVLAVTGAGAAFAATHGSGTTAPSKKPAQQKPVRMMDHGPCPNMGSSSHTSSSTADY
jgi:hypothetical protein